MHTPMQISTDKLEIGVRVHFLSLFREVGALANDLPNRIIDIHHGMHGRNLSLPEITGKRQKGDLTRSGAPFSGRAHFEFGRR